MDGVIYLLVPAEEGEKAGQLGAQWDPVKLRWFIRMDQDPLPFLEWLPIDDHDQDDLPELCVAAPIYVVEAKVTCHGCGCEAPVITLAAEHFGGGDEEAKFELFDQDAAAAHAFDADIEGLSEDDYYADEGGGEEDDYHQEGGLMRFHLIREMPADVASFLARWYPYFRKRADTGEAGEAYFCNQCSCGEPFEEFALHAEPGSGFYLFSRQDAQKVALRELPTADTMMLRANFGMVVPDVILKYAQRKPFPVDS